MTGSSTKLEDTGGTKRLKAMFAKLQKQIPAVVLEIGAQMALEASTRAPSPEDEYQVMLGGEGNPEGLKIDGGPGQMDSDHRIRFDKPSGFFLQPVIEKNFQMIGPMQVGVGSIDELNVASQYTWTNIDGESYTSSFPFWECWEGGLSGTFQIHPVNYKKDYLIVPSPGDTRSTMTKTIPRLGMYLGVDVGYHLEETLYPAIRRIVREA